MSNWRDDWPLRPEFSWMDWVRIVLRGIAMGGLIFGGLAVLLLVRVIEAPLYRAHRPWTPFITQFVCKGVFRILRFPLTVKGRPMEHDGAMVSNHCSWLDIFALNACARIYFVAKAEVSTWPGIGWLARGTGTVFIARKGSEAKKQQALFEDRLRSGHRLVFFPEGTSTDCLRMLPFKTTLFEAFFTHGLEKTMHIQPVSLTYHAPQGEDPRFYGWYSEMDFASHLLLVLARKYQGRVEIEFHTEVPVDAFSGRKALAGYCEQVVRAGLPPTTLASH